MVGVQIEPKRRVNRPGVVETLETFELLLLKDDPLTLGPETVGEAICRSWN